MRYCERLINSSRLDDAMKMDTRTINKPMGLGLDTKPLDPPSNRAKPNPKTCNTGKEKKIRTYLGIGGEWGKDTRPI